ADLAGVRADGPRGQDDRLGLVQDAVESGETAGRVHDRRRRVDREGRVVHSVEVERHGPRDAVHGAREDLGVVELGAAVRVDDERAIDRRGPSKVRVYAAVALTSMIRFGPADRTLLKVADVLPTVPPAAVGGAAAPLETAANATTRGRSSRP